MHPETPMQDPYGIDHHKLIYHPRRTARWLEAGSDWEKAREVYPLYLEVSPVGACNHRCTFCSMDYMNAPSHRLDLALMERVLPELGKLQVKSMMFAGEGEPLLYPDMPRLAGLAADAGIDIAFTTNGVLLTRPVAESLLPITAWIKTSLDAGTRETYAAVHQTQASDFDQVLDNLEYAVRYRDRNGIACTLGGQILLLPENYREVVTLARICRDRLGLDYLVIKPHSQHLYSHTKRYETLDYAPMLEEVKKSLDLASTGFKVIYREQTLQKHMDNRYSAPRCLAVPFFWAYVTSNHDVYACSAFLKDQRFLLGNLGKDSFRGLWQGDRRRRLFEMMTSDFDIGECRLNCRMNSINQYLWNLRHPHAHVNFI